MPVIIAMAGLGVMVETAKVIKENLPLPFDIDDKTIVDLLPLEEEYFLYEEPITTITFCKGDVKVATERLQSRWEAILHQNPWLGSRLVKRNAPIKLYFHPKASDVPPNMLRVIDTEQVQKKGISRDTPYQDYAHLLKEFDLQVKKNTILIGKDEPMFKLTLIPDAKQPKERFALAMSMSHILGDAHTYYKIFNMLNCALDENDVVVAMNPHRKQEFTKAAEKVMGHEEVHYLKRILDNPDLNEMLTSASSSKGDKVCVGIVEISEDWIEKQKVFAVVTTPVSKCSNWISKWRRRIIDLKYCCKQGGAEVPALDDVKSFDATKLTTNDVVTSWFWRQVKASVGLMAYNFRDRMDPTYCNCSSLDAGNYQNPIPYTKGDYESPELIHKSVKTARRAGSDDKGLGTTLPLLSLAEIFSCSTNWVSFYEGELNLGGSGNQVESHVPLYDWTQLKKVPVNNLSTIALFTLGKGKGTGAFVVAPQSVISAMESSGMVKETIAKVTS